VRAHARQRRAKATRLRADDVDVDEEDRLLVGVPREVLLDALEIEADLWVGIEGKLRLWAELFYRGGTGHRGLLKVGAMKHGERSPLVPANVPR